MRFIATQRAAAGLEEPPAYKAERRGREHIVAFHPALFLNLNNICTLGGRVWKRDGPRKQGRTQDSRDGGEKKKNKTQDWI